MDEIKVTPEEAVNMIKEILLAHDAIICIHTEAIASLAVLLGELTQEVKKLVVLPR